MHSPEPWTKRETLCDAEHDTIFDANNNPVIPDCVCTYESEPPDIAPDDLERICACVNALKDVPNPQEFMKAVMGLREHCGQIILPTAKEAIRNVVYQLDVEVPS